MDIDNSEMDFDDSEMNFDSPGMDFDETVIESFAANSVAGQK